MSRAQAGLWATNGGALLDQCDELLRDTVGDDQDVVKEQRPGARALEILGEELVEADQGWDTASAFAALDLSDPLVVELAGSWLGTFIGGDACAEGEGDLAARKGAIHVALLAQLDT